MHPCFANKKPPSSKFKIGNMEVIAVGRRHLKPDKRTINQIDRRSLVLHDTDPEHLALVEMTMELEERTNASVELNVILGGTLGSEADDNQVITEVFDTVLIQGIVENAGQA